MNHWWCDRYEFELLRIRYTWDILHLFYTRLMIQNGFDIFISLLNIELFRDTVFEAEIFDNFSKESKISAEDDLIIIWIDSFRNVEIRIRSRPKSVVHVICMTFFSLLTVTDLSWLFISEGWYVTQKKILPIVEKAQKKMLVWKWTVISK